MNQEAIKTDTPRNPIRTSNKMRTSIIVLTILLSAAAGLAGLLFSSNYAPFFFAGVVVALILLGVFIYRPEWSLYMAILIVFLPLGLLPLQVQSYANRGMVVFVFVVWLYNTISKRRKVILPAATSVFLMFIAWSILTLIWTERFDVSLTVLQTYILRWIFFLFLTVNLVDTKEKLNGLMNTLGFIGIVLIIGGLIELAVNGYDPNVRFTILGMNENEVGLMFLIALIGVLWWGSQPSERFAGTKKFLSAAFLLITIALTAMSGSRGSTISLVIAIIAFGFFKPTRQWVWITIIIIMLGLIAAPFIFSTVIERFEFSGIKGDTMLGGREGLWQAAWLLMRDNIWLGVGIGNADYAIVPYLSHPSVPSVVMPISMWSAENDSLHNPVFTVLAETGIIGITLYLGTMLAAVVNFIRSYFKCQTAELKIYYALVGSVFFGYLFSWIKGGGIQSGHSYFMMLALLTLPTCIMAQKLHGASDTAE